uniref:Uncharacterized protein n=1 Tax=Pygocentrus nattereri TaxID=42514 RepID=A0A3B4DZ96_PYGNA
MGILKICGMSLKVLKGHKRNSSTQLGKRKLCCAEMAGVEKQGAVSLPKHSYWFDFWVFVLFDIAFFLFMYFVVP